MRRKGRWSALHWPRRGAAGRGVSSWKRESLKHRAVDFCSNAWRALPLRAPPLRRLWRSTGWTRLPRTIRTIPMARNVVPVAVISSPRAHARSFPAISAPAAGATGSRRGGKASETSDQRPIISQATSKARMAPPVPIASTYFIGQTLTAWRASVGVFSMGRSMSR